MEAHCIYHRNKSVEFNYTVCGYTPVAEIVVIMSMSMFIVCPLRDKVQKHDCTQTGRQS